MIREISNIIRAVFSNSALEKVYERRRMIVSNRNNRTLAAVLIVGGILLGLIAFAGGMFFIERDSRSYLSTRNRVNLLDADSKKMWSFGLAPKCTDKNANCGPLALGSVSELKSISIKDLREVKLSSDNPQLVRINFKIDASEWRSLSEYLTLTVSLPNFKYSRADVFLNGERQRSFFLARPIHFPFETHHVRGQPLEIDVLMETSKAYPFAMGSRQPAFISTQSEFEKFGEYLTLQRSGRGNWIAIVSRITLALFAIGLFLLIDSSTESLALALFMGFEALGIAARQGWLPLSALGPWLDLFTAAFFTNLGLAFRLYFYANLARLAGSSLNRWFVIAMLWSLPMGYYAMDSANKPASLYHVFFAFGSLTVSLAGIVFCLRSYIYIRNKNLHWRHMALLSAIVAGLPSVLLSIDQIYPPFIVQSGIVDSINTLNFNSGFLLALSAFFNISSLENRVRTLSLAQVRAKQLEMELELARSVQKQHMRLPEKPPGVSIECYQSPASYVSGDTYFFNWNQNQKVFTFLLNDVTGHGVQAALKATICNVMAEMVWAEDSVTSRRRDLELPIVRYHSLICKYLSERFQLEDLHSVCGGEFYPETGRLLLFRSNSPSPMILQPSDHHETKEAQYAVENLALQNQVVTEYQLRPGAVVMLMSDGILFSSREQANISRRLNELSLEFKDRNFLLGRLKDEIMSISDSSARASDDDRTLLIFRWEHKGLRLTSYKNAS
jgi:hypothetical protein